VVVADQAVTENERVATDNDSRVADRVKTENDRVTTDNEAAAVVAEGRVADLHDLHLVAAGDHRAGGAAVVAAGERAAAVVAAGERAAVVVAAGERAAAVADAGAARLSLQPSNRHLRLSRLRGMACS